MAESQRDVPAALDTLLTVAVVFRLVGLVWLLSLSVLSLVTEGTTIAETQTANLIMGAMTAAVVWTVVTVVVWRLRPGWLSRLGFLGSDLAIGGLIALVPNLAGTSGFFVGGFPISAAVLAGTTRGIAAAGIGGAVIAAASAVGYGSEQAARTAEVVAINLLAPMVVAWAFASIRRNDERRRTAEEALVKERAERARAAERAEVAAHLHDSVLQTLALIQRKSGDEGEVLRLARSQERELRTWLNGGSRTGDRLMDVIVGAAGEIEQRFGVVVDVSTVGDAELDRDVEAVAAATREAILNAAKFSGVERIYVLAEARPHEVRVVVRDKGIGFDRAHVATDRRGLVESVEGRMDRHGGTASVWSRPGEGTEVDIRLPRKEGE